MEEKKTGKSGRPKSGCLRKQTSVAVCSFPVSRLRAPELNATPPRPGYNALSLPLDRSLPFFPSHQFSLASSPLRFPRSHSLLYSHSHHLLFFVLLFVQIAEMAIDKVDAKEREKIEAVRKLLRKQAPLSAKQVMPENQLCSAYKPTSASVRLSKLVFWFGHGGEQAQYCNDACVERFLRSRGENVKKAAKHLRTVLSWRETVGAGTLISFHPFLSLSHHICRELSVSDPPRWVVKQKEASVFINASLRCYALLEPPWSVLAADDTYGTVHF